MKIYNAFSLMVLLSVFVLSGCVIRTYEITKQRVDQDLTGGNCGYIMGQAPEEMNMQERKRTRKTQVIEVELYSPIKFMKKRRAKSMKTEEARPEKEEIMGNRGYLVGGSMEREGMAAKQKFEKYTVRRWDTLQKVSKRFYGTTKKWNMIYEANKDKIKSANKIYPGQVLDIPVETMEEMEENLK